MHIREYRTQAVLWVGLLAAAALAAWLVFLSIRSLLSLDKTIFPAVAAALVAVFSIIFTFLKDRANARKEAHRLKKVEAYARFYDMIFGLISRAKEEQKNAAYLASSEFQDAFIQLMRDVMFYGSPRVIRSLSEFRLLSAKAQSGDPFLVLRKIGDVILAMRSDIGLSNFGLNNLSIHQLYVTDNLANLGKGG